MHSWQRAFAGRACLFGTSCRCHKAFAIAHYQVNGLLMQGHVHLLGAPLVPQDVCYHTHSHEKLVRLGPASLLRRMRRASPARQTSVLALHIFMCWACPCRACLPPRRMRRASLPRRTSTYFM